MPIYQVGDTVDVMRRKTPGSTKTGVEEWSKKSLPSKMRMVICSFSSTSNMSWGRKKGAGCFVRKVAALEDEAEEEGDATTTAQGSSRRRTRARSEVKKVLQQKTS